MEFVAAAFHEDFCSRQRAPRYNPARRTFRKEDWLRVVDLVAADAKKLGCSIVAERRAPLKAVAIRTVQEIDPSVGRNAAHDSVVSIVSDQCGHQTSDEPPATG